MRIKWDRHEVALLFAAYEHVAGGSDIEIEATQLSKALRNLAIRRRVSIDDTYRNINGMKMQLANVQYLFTNGEKGLSGASALIRQMFELYQTNQAEYQTILKEAIHMTGTTPMSVEEAFFSYAKDKTSLPPKMLADYLKKAADYCHLKQPLLGMADVKAVRNVQQKVAEGKLLRFRFGKDAQTIRNITQLYYNFVKSYREPKEETGFSSAPAQKKPAGNPVVAELSQAAPAITQEISLDEFATSLEQVQEDGQSEESESAAEKTSVDSSAAPFSVDFSRDNSYLFTKPITYTYKGQTYPAKSWNRIYVEICGLLFADQRDVFMGIMNGDIPGYNSLAFADEQHKSDMRVARQFAPGYYLESNMDATTIVRRIRGLYQLFNLGDGLRISYLKTGDAKPRVDPVDTGEEWIIRELRSRKIPFTDNRAVDGCLWIASDMSIPILLEEAASRGYHLRVKQDGCRAYPNRPVLWTKDQPASNESVQGPYGNFRRFLIEKQQLAEPTVNNYIRSMHRIEEYIEQRHLSYRLSDCNADEMQHLINGLKARPDFEEADRVRHRQFSAALKQYLMFLQGSIKTVPDFARNRQITIKQAIIRILTEERHPLTASEIMQRILARDLYQFNSQNPQQMVIGTILKSCHGTSGIGHTKEDAFIRVEGQDKISRFYLLNVEPTDNIQNASNEEALTLRDQVLTVAYEAFPNGMRPGSIIDLNKLKRSYVNHYNKEIPESTDIASLLTAAGIRNGEKIYILSDEQKRQLRDLIESIFAEGYRVIYYSELLRQHGSLMESCHLFEAALMRTVFASLFPTAICKAEWMLADRSANEIEEITRAFGEDLVLTYGQIKDRCPYLTLDVIKWALSRSNRFVWSSPETFVQTDLIQLDEGEVQKVRRDVLPKLGADGYYSLARLPLEDSCALNPQISVSAVRDAMFIRHMAAECDRNGLIATPKGVRATSAQLLEGWCREHDELTIDELEAYERELTGHHAVLGIWAACYNMVRIDHDHFVSDALIDFDIDRTDRAIDLFVGNRVVPITAITSFTSFPEVAGYTWNLYLVESFLRRFSRRFTIDGGPAQMSYVGGICPTSMRFDCYEDRLACAVVQDNVRLTEDSVGRYLTEKKYILRRSDTVRKVLTKAVTLNEQRGDPSVRL